MSTLNASFEEAIRVTPEGNNKYSATLRPEWCIGAGISRLIPANFQAHPWLIILIVPHGGYTTSVLYRLALVHFAHAHPNKYSTPASPISLQLSFLRRTLAGPATMEVEDVKLGARTSTIHIKLLQPSEKKPNESEIKVAGYITVSPPDAEIGITASTGWKPHPTPPIGSGPGGEINFSALASKGSDGRWIKLEPPFPEFRRAAAQLELYGPGKGDEQQKETGSMAIDQWARFRPNGDVNGRWTDAAIPYLIDMFPMALDGFDTVSANATAKEQGKGGASEGDKAKFWYPTVTLNVDMKKHLPVEGVEWLYSRIVTKVVRDGRTDLDVTVLDQNGDVIALSTQVGLVVSASRNLGTRKMQKL
ncbi:uncharacterized protein N7469_000786 [Penicillium citrinum]|uniref:Thioesterase-like superfamily-domain-containing protein n=2 Tax=Penicillium TaxID=5073 RepID=A0A9W9PFR1_PENCI|nr:uncharacterized protein N7469_000786 [Penicillium citrinum]KAJ5242459.1 hypothetical protein N7469_000786 [Penicillium citrinum]KAJ5600042.1 hypothetical protein N7450_001109 [Penicillium hetheringtonii]KAK5806888.1 hypothetical protein VI817_001146 [Penicillium citrinum]